MSARYTAAAAASGRRMPRSIAAAFAVVFVFGCGALFAAAGAQTRSVGQVRSGEQIRLAETASSTEPVRLAQGAARNVGQQVYEKWCAPCHAPGPDHPGTTALAALYKGTKPAALIERTDLTAPIVKQFVRKGVSVMPFFRKTEISDAELDALASFLSRGRG
jgi:mono/diheme cytochrome c family protein